MPIDWAAVGLTQRELRKARKEAAKFLGDNPVVWDELGIDEQEEKADEYLRHLRDTKNAGVAKQSSLAQESEST
jgi:hypothetical protein